MSFWDIFKNKEESAFLNNLHETLSQKLPDTSDNDLIFIACLSGLLARVAYVDLKIHENEKEHIKKIILNSRSLSNDQAELVAEMALNEMKLFAGLDTRNYLKPLNDILNNNEKFEITKLLFEVAASDGSIDNIESEEIRIIVKGLLLEHKHFIAAKAYVTQKVKEQG